MIGMRGAWVEVCSSRLGSHEFFFVVQVCCSVWFDFFWGLRDAKSISLRRGRHVRHFGVPIFRSFFQRKSAFEEIYDGTRGVSLLSYKYVTVAYTQ